ncbi:MAG: tRNA epoxyqueuosine(34) reductase QueG, partial [Caulobacteraceae bacterium]|nr:tRNA epoxyqueuosine(34) reductase QueG [Caulobacter sp.]
MPSSLPAEAKPRIRAQAAALGFDACRVASVEAPWEAGGRLAEFVAQGRHGDMEWMASTAERRAHPRALWGEARSALALGLNYGPDRDPREALADPARGAISVYAQGDDYHEVVKARLKRLGRWIAAEFKTELKVFVDTAPLMEKPLAQAAGLGWQGKHTNLVSREWGSWLFLGAILLPLALEPDAPERETCGSCRACLDACPTDAFPAPFQIDARRCISYLTIEHRGPIPEEFREALGARIYGCDDCLSACPWNKFARTARESAFHAREELKSPPLADLLALDDAAFRALFRKSPVKRIGRDRFLRNVLYAAGNSGEAALVPAVARLAREDGSELVRDAAAWALSRLPG